MWLFNENVMILCDMNDYYYFEEFKKSVLIEKKSFS